MKGTKQYQIQTNERKSENATMTNKDEDEQYSLSKTWVHLVRNY